MKTRFPLALRTFGVMLAGLFVAATVSTPALAATYKVRVYAGNEGTVNGKSDYAEISVDEGSEVKLSDEFTVKVTDEAKYYFKGYRLSGKDNRDPGALSDDIIVTEDTDFVVAYGASGTSMTSYTIKFVESGTGKALTNDDGVTSVTYQGKVGDKPVVAYAYVKGYRPLYRNITGTLKEGSNEWSLPYKAIETEVIDEGTTITPGTTTVVRQTGSGSTTTTTSRGTSTTSTSSTSSSGTSTRSTASTGSESSTSDDSESSTTTTTTTTTPTSTTTTPTAATPTEEILDVDEQPEAADQSGDEANDATTDDSADTESTDSTATPESTETTEPATDETAAPEDDEGLSPFAAVLGAAGVAALGGLSFFIVKRKQEG